VGDDRVGERVQAVLLAAEVDEGTGERGGGRGASQLLGLKPEDITRERCQLVEVEKSLELAAQNVDFPA
jgi:hypothetical protein